MCGVRYSRRATSGLAPSAALQVVCLACTVPPPPPPLLLLLLLFHFNIQISDDGENTRLLHLVFYTLDTV